MALKFNGDSIDGTHGPIYRPSPEPNLRRVRFAFLKGEGEIRGSSHGRTLMCRIILHKAYTGTKPDKLLKALDKLDKAIGTHGTLKESGNIEQEFENCTFEGYEPMPLEGQEESGPLKDSFGGLRTANGTADNGWWICVLLRFRQLLVPEAT